MEDQILQYEMTDMLGKSHDSELGQNTINIASHLKKIRKQENIYFYQLLEYIYNLMTFHKWHYNETFQK